MAARAVPAFYLHFIYCGMQFAVVANELNMRIAIIPKENEKSEPFSNRKQVRIFLVWWARVDSNNHGFVPPKPFDFKKLGIMRIFGHQKMEHENFSARTQR